MSAARVRLWLVVWTGGAALLVSVVGGVITAGRGDGAGALVWVALAIVPPYAVALWVVRLRPDHPQARRLLLVSASMAAAAAVETLTGAAYRRLGTGSWLVPVAVAYQYATLISMIAISLLVASYPDGVVERPWQRMVLRGLWWQLAIPPLLLLTASSVVIPPYFPIPARTRIPSPIAVPWLGWAAPTLAGLLLNYFGIMVATAVLLVRYLRADRARRRRMRLLVYAMLAGSVVLVGDSLVRAAGLPQTSVWSLAISVLSVLDALSIPVIIVAGILRHRLFDIDVVVRRSVVYGALSLGIAAVYVGVAAAPGLALGGRIPVALAVTVTIIAAWAFQPIVRRLEALADRWVFGERVNRYQVLSSYGATLERTAELAELLPTLAMTVRRGLGAAWVRVSLSGEQPGSWLEAPRGGPAYRPEPRRWSRTSAGPTTCWDVSSAARSRTATTRPTGTCWPPWPPSRPPRSPTCGSPHSCPTGSTS